MKLGNRMTKDGVLVLQCDEARSQHQNKALVIKRFFLLLKNALTVPKKHKTTQPSKAAKERRLKAKRVAAEKKAHRKKPRLD